MQQRGDQGMHETTLKTALLSNAIFSTLSGVMSIIFAHAVAELIGAGEPILYQIIGAGLLGFAGLVAWTGTRRPINTLLAALISIADFSWVAGTLLLISLTFAGLQPVGILTVLAIAGVVLFFGLRQLQGIGKVYAVTGKPHTHGLCVAVDTPAAPDAIWPIIADLPSIRLYSPNLTQVILRDGAESGVNAVRQCTDVKGKIWGEHCRQYDAKTRRIAFEFLADEPGFPYPFKTMLGGWEVEPNGAGSIVKIWFEVTPKYGLAHPILLTLMARNLANGFGEVVARMTADARGEVIPVKVSPARQGVKSVLAVCR